MNMMKQTTIWECENCHKTFHSEEDAQKHETECESLNNIFVKEIRLNHDSAGYALYDLFKVTCYPNAKYRKSDDTIQLYERDRYRSKSKFDFEKIQKQHRLSLMFDDTDDDDLVVYTTGDDIEHEKELMKQLIEYRLNDLNFRKEAIDNEITKLKNIKNIENIKNNCIWRSDNATWANERFLDGDND